MTSKAVQIYGDMMSQPTRAVVWLCTLNKIPHKFVSVQIAKGENRSPEFVKKNPTKKVPCIEDDNVFIFESHAILRYLCQKHKAADQWYPQNLVKRAKVDQYLDWHHSNLRYGASRTLFMNLLGPRMGLPPAPDALKAEAKKVLAQSLKSFEELWLANTNYILSDQPSIADLSAHCELEALSLMKYDLSAYPKLLAWAKRMESLEGYGDINKIMEKVKAKL